LATLKSKNEEPINSLMKKNSAVILEYSMNTKPWFGLFKSKRRPVI